MVAQSNKNYITTDGSSNIPATTQAILPLAEDIEGNQAQHGNDFSGE